MQVVERRLEQAADAYRDVGGRAASGTGRRGGRAASGTGGRGGRAASGTGGREKSWMDLFRAAKFTATAITVLSKGNTSSPRHGRDHLPPQHASLWIQRAQWLR